MIANFFMAVGLGITIYYLVQDIPDASARPHFNASINTIPQFFSIVIFAMEAIGVVSIEKLLLLVCVNGVSVDCRYTASNWKVTFDSWEGSGSGRGLIRGTVLVHVRSY